MAANTTKPVQQKPTEYRGIKLWGEHLGSLSYYIKDEQARASRDGAPVDALFYSRELKKWQCVSDLVPGHSFRAHYDAMLARDQ